MERPFPEAGTVIDRGAGSWYNSSRFAITPRRSTNLNGCGASAQQNEPKEAMAKSPRFAYGRLVDNSRLKLVLRESRMTIIGLFLFG